MPSQIPPAADAFSANEIARAAGVPVAAVRALVDAGAVETADGRFLGYGQAIRAVRLLTRRESSRDRALFAAAPGERRKSGVPFLASGAVHASVLGLVLLITSLGLRDAATEARTPTHARLIFLMAPGPGGGGGGGGLRQPAPAPKAAAKGRSALKSPVPVERVVRKTNPERARPVPPPRVEPVAHPPEPQRPAQKENPAPPVLAPVVSAPADERDRPGVLTASTSEAAVNGSGSGGGTGTGNGTGIGEGTGPGIGDGAGGGTGGGPYGPGSGVTAPSLLREVKPEYTEDARRRGLEGDVMLEIVVRADGSVGRVTLLRGLGSGLDQRAADAVRQWKFAPARRHGTPVDVVVEVAVEFRLR